MNNNKHYLYADELNTTFICEGMRIVFEMPPFCSGIYEAVVKVDKQGRHYIFKDENHFDSCRDYQIIIPKSMEVELIYQPEPVDSNIIELNLNKEVLVKLNAFGYSIWLNYNNQLIKYNPNIKPETLGTLYSKEDKDGYVKFHMWEFMYIFGQHTAMGLNSPFETLNIKILLDS